MRRLVWWALVTVLLVARALYADGEPTAEQSDSGIIVPIDSQQAEVVEQRVTATLPPPKLAWERPATIRAEYVLRNRGRAPLQMTIGWPVSRTGYNGDVHRVGLPVVKLDGKSAPATFLSLDDLAEAYANEWLPRIDKLLEAKPELREQVLAARRDKARAAEESQGSRQSPRSAPWQPSALSRWLHEHEPSTQRFGRPEELAAGLVGAGHSGSRCDQTMQQVLRWLDPSYQYVHIYPLLAERWDQETRLLDPITGQLVDTRQGMLDWEPSFGIFRFSVTLAPGRKHRLVVQYGQFLGWDSSCLGLAYVMKPAQRWGRWGRTTIEVLAPPQWQTVGIRPAAKKVGTRSGMALYRIRMGRPSENLYVSVDTERRDTALWSRRADAVVSQWLDGKHDKAAKEFLSYGRGPATAAMRRLIRELPAGDGRRFDAGFVLYVLDLDRALGRSAMVRACAPWKYSSVEYPSALLSAAYQHHPDARLITAGLNLTRHVREGAVFEMGELLRQLAEDNPRDLLTALRGKPQRVWDDAAFVLYQRGEQGEPVRYRGLQQVARDDRNPQRSEAQQLTAAIDAIQGQIQRQEERQFPLVPKGVTLPASAVKALRSRYPHWHVMGTNGFAPEVVASVQKRFGKGAGPQHVWGDFDGNGLGDVALLVRGNGGDGVKLIAMRQWKADRWAADELTSFPFSGGLQGGYSGFTIYITPRAPGEVAYWQDQGKTGRLDLGHDGVELGYEGKASMLYYWTGSGWDKVQTGD
jgi:hypothetical protein